VPVTALGAGTATVGAGVYEYVHAHFTVNTVDPPTVAVNEYTWLATTVAAVGLIVTVTTFALELPQPATHAVAHNPAATAASFIIRNFILTSPPYTFPGIPTTLPCSISMPSSRSPLSHFLLQSPTALLPWCFFVLSGAKNPPTPPTRKSFQP